MTKLCSSLPFASGGPSVSISISLHNPFLPSSVGSALIQLLMDSTPQYADLVLVGGGHAHVHLLKMYAMEHPNQIKGVRLTLITRDINTSYSGMLPGCMLPGFISGRYNHDECHIDLSKLASFGGWRLIHASATKITNHVDSKTREAKMNANIFTNPLLFPVWRR